DTRGAGHVGDSNRPEIGQSGLRTDRGELRTVDGNLILALGTRIRERFKRAGHGKNSSAASPARRVFQSENRPVLRSPRFDSGWKGALAYGGFLRKTVITPRARRSTDRLLRVGEM